MGKQSKSILIPIIYNQIFRTNALGIRREKKRDISVHSHLAKGFLVNFPFSQAWELLASKKIRGEPQDLEGVGII